MLVPNNTTPRQFVAEMFNTKLNKLGVAIEYPNGLISLTKSNIGPSRIEAKIVYDLQGGYSDEQFELMGKTPIKKRIRERKRKFTVRDIGSRLTRNAVVNGHFHIAVDFPLEDIADPDNKDMIVFAINQSCGADILPEEVTLSGFSEVPVGGQGAFDVLATVTTSDLCLRYKGSFKIRLSEANPVYQYPTVVVGQRVGDALIYKGGVYADDFITGYIGTVTKLPVELGEYLSITHMPETAGEDVMGSRIAFMDNTAASPFTVHQYFIDSNGTELSLKNNAGGVLAVLGLEANQVEFHVQKIKGHIRLTVVGQANEETLILPFDGDLTIALTKQYLTNSVKVGAAYRIGFYGEQFLAGPPDQPGYNFYAQRYVPAMFNNFLDPLLVNAPSILTNSIIGDGEPVTTGRAIATLDRARASGKLTDSVAALNRTRTRRFKISRYNPVTAGQLPISDTGYVNLGFNVESGPATKESVQAALLQNYEFALELEDFDYFVESAGFGTLTFSSICLTYIGAISINVFGELPDPGGFETL